MAFGGNFGGKKWQEGIWREKIEFWREKMAFGGKFGGNFLHKPLAALIRLPCVDGDFIISSD